MFRLELRRAGDDAIEHLPAVRHIDQIETAQAGRRLQARLRGGIAWRLDLAQAPSGWARRRSTPPPPDSRSRSGCRRSPASMTTAWRHERRGTPAMHGGDRPGDRTGDEKQRLAAFRTPTPPGVSPAPTRMPAGPPSAAQPRSVRIRPVRQQLCSTGLPPRRLTPDIARPHIAPARWRAGPQALGADPGATSDQAADGGATGAGQPSAVR